MSHVKTTFYSHGKLLLTGEYVILDGAKGIALPTKKGQSLEVSSTKESKLHFESKDHLGEIWFSAIFDLGQLRKTNGLHFSNALEHTTNDAIAHTLSQILESIFKQNPGALNLEKGLKLTSILEFPRNWGLGSSSTFINNLAAWSSTDGYTILKDSLGGSGYDLACASAAGPISFQRTNKKPQADPVAFDPVFKDQLYFVHLNEKQNSREGISRYRELTHKPAEAIDRISEISNMILEATSLDGFNLLIEQHEELISSLIALPPVKEKRFKDYPGSIKSLGAWGGDFVLATAKEDPSDYFRDRGYPTIISYKDFIL